MDGERVQRFRMTPGAWLGAGVALLVVLFVGSGYVTRRASEQRVRDDHERSLSLAASAAKAADERRAVEKVADEARRAADEEDFARTIREAEARRAKLAAMTPSDRLNELVELCNAAGCEADAAATGAIVSSAKTDAERSLLTKRASEESKAKARVELAVLRTAERERLQQRLPVKRSGSCLVTAQRMITRMTKCGLNMEGINSERLCSSIDTDAISFAASRSCEELGAMILERER